jgi:hypothetical protein
MAAAATLACAIAGLPVVLDQCVESCEAHRSAISSAPTCHHVAPASTRIGGVPSPCGHDHSAVVTAAAYAVLKGPSIDVAVAIEAPPPPAISQSTARGPFSQSPPGSSLTFERHSLPLRI